MDKAHNAAAGDLWQNPQGNSASGRCAASQAACLESPNFATRFLHSIPLARFAAMRDIEIGSREPLHRWHGARYEQESRMQGASRRSYREYGQGEQRRSRLSCS